MDRRFALTRTIALVTAIGIVAACNSTSDDAERKTLAKTDLAKTDVAPASAVIDDAAVEILRKAAHHIRGADALSVSAVTGYDVLQADGQKVEFGGSFSATIQRPDRAAMKSKRRDGVRLQITLDGNDLWMYSPDHEVYAHEPQPGDIDVSLNHMLDELGISTPLSNLFSDSLGSSLATDLRSCYLVGDSSIADHECHHIAARNSYADYQIWIDKGDIPALRRLVITYREEAGHPQYWAYFTEWEFGIKPPSSTFIFQPPAGSERIRLAHVNDGEE